MRFLGQLGEMAEWSIAAVLKTVEGNTSGGSNPSFSATSKGDKLHGNELPLLFMILQATGHHHLRLRKRKPL